MKHFLLKALVVLSAPLGAQQSPRQAPRSADGIVHVTSIGVKGHPQLPYLSFESIQNAWKEAALGFGES